MIPSRAGIRARPSLARRLDVAARHGFPITTTLLLLLAWGAPLGLPGRADMQVSLTLCCVFFWSVFRPAAMPPAAVFLIGLLLDLLGFGPLGINAVVLLVSQAAALRWRRELARGGFFLTWLVFAAIATAAAGLGWALTSLLGLRLYPMPPAALQAALCAGLYPIVWVVLARAHQTLAEPDRA